MMFNGRYILLILLLYMMILPYPMVSAKDKFPPLDVSISVNSDKNSYFRWEPINVTYIVTNNNGTSNNFDGRYQHSITIFLPKNFSFKDNPFKKKLQINLPKSYGHVPKTTYANLTLTYNKSAEPCRVNLLGKNTVIKYSWDLKPRYDKTSYGYYIYIINDPPKLSKFDKNDAENDSAFTIECLDNDSMKLSCILRDVNNTRLETVDVPNKDLGNRISQIIAYTGQGKPRYACLSDGINQSENVELHVDNYIGTKFIHRWYIPISIIVFSLFLTPEISFFMFLYNRCSRKTINKASKSNWYFIPDVYMVCIMIGYCLYGFNLNWNTNMPDMLTIVSDLISIIALFSGIIISKYVPEILKKLLPLIVIWLLILVAVSLDNFYSIFVILFLLPTIIYIYYCYSNSGQ